MGQTIHIKRYKVCDDPMMCTIFVLFCSTRSVGNNEALHYYLPSILNKTKRIIIIKRARHEIVMYFIPLYCYLIIIMEICKAPTLRLKELNKSSVTHIMNKNTICARHVLCNPLLVYEDPVKCRNRLLLFFCSTRLV